MWDPYGEALENYGYFCTKWLRNEEYLVTAQRRQEPSELLPYSTIDGYYVGRLYSGKSVFVSEWEFIQWSYRLDIRLPKRV